MAHEVAESAGVGTIEDQIAPQQRLGTFYSLRYPDFNLLLQGQIGAAASMWMENIARPLLIYELTDSALMVGLLHATRMAPQLLLGIWAGVIADRMDKRKILLISKTVTLTSMAVTALLIISGVITPWMVFVTTFITGSSMAFDGPARQSLIPRLVPERSLANAIALNLAAMNLMRIGGPSLAGLILVFFDFGPLYVIQSAMYAWVIFCTLRIKTRTEEQKRVGGSMFAELVEGFEAVKRDRIIFYILILCLSMFVLGFPYQGLFIPLIAVEELDIGKSGAGLLISVTGIGAIIGSLSIATYGDRLPGRGFWLLAFIIIFGLALLLFAQTQFIPLVILALIVTGGMQTAFMSLNNAYVLQRTAPALQGRVMSLFSLDRGLMPLGAALGGFLAEELGPSTGLSIMAGLCIGCTLVLTILVPSLRRIR
ncbi:MAG: MFS transporter [Dehalococcoidia bacterium]|nr:MFS transporter [Dehalococcoidia bacterium]